MYMIYIYIYIHTYSAYMAETSISRVFRVFGWTSKRALAFRQRDVAVEGMETIDFGHVLA